MDFSNKTDEIRNKSVILFNKFIKNKKISRKIEKSIYNYIIHLSKEKNISRSWNNIIFKNLYISKIRSIYTNINKDNDGMKNKNTSE